MSSWANYKTSKLSKPSINTFVQNIVQPVQNIVQPVQNIVQPVQNIVQPVKNTITFLEKKIYNKSDIENIYINFSENPNDFSMKKYFNINAVFDINISYINENELLFSIDVRKHTDEYDGKVSVFIHNKTNPSIYFKIKLESLFKSHSDTYKSSFILVKDNTDYIHKIPKIIHQSYCNKLAYNNYKASSSWNFMNPNYTYMYWTDEDIEIFLKKYYDINVINAYNLLYAGAYKSDIFRLCILLHYGGIWTDISSICETSLDNIIKKDEELIVPIDLPSNNFVLYQAFIISTPNNPIIKYILDYTVNRVLNNKEYNNSINKLLHPIDITKESIGVTGPLIFGLGLNLYLKRELRTPYIIGKLNNIRFLGHKTNVIFIENNDIIVTTKYKNFNLDRINKHYSILFNEGYVYKVMIKDSIRYNPMDNNTIFQIWIQNNMVSANMNNAINSWKNKHNTMNYALITNDIFLKDIKTDNLGLNNLYEAYISIKPYGFKADIIRLYYLYKYGGIYADIDSVCITPCYELLHKYDLVLSNDLDGKSKCNGFIISKKHNPFFIYYLNHIILKIMNRIKITSKNQLLLTGPQLCGQLFSEYYNDTHLNIKILSHTEDIPNYANIDIKNSYIKHPGSGVICDNENKQIILLTKYQEYNYEKNNILQGNDYAKMSETDNIYTNSLPN
jgi:mannosyltransferase OCH1-like enzyme